MNHPTFLEILAHTPPWVFAVFLALLSLGYHQSRNRTVSRGRLLLLPVAMLGLSLYGVASSFGLAFLPLLTWVFGVGVIATLGAKRLQSSAQQVAPGFFLVKGSWWPLALMMAIFFIKYIIGYASARNLSVVLQPWFVGTSCALLGIVSGTFLARTSAAWRTGTRRENYA